MTTKQKEIKTSQTVYVAIDGTEFSNAEECRKYENSALGVLRGKLKEFCLDQKSECDIYCGAGSDENTCFILRPRDEKDLNVIRQILFLQGNQEGYVSKLTDDQVGRIIILTFSYDDSSSWFTTLDEVVEQIAGNTVTLSYSE